MDIQKRNELRIKKEAQKIRNIEDRNRKLQSRINALARDLRRMGMPYSYGSVRGILADAIKWALSIDGDYLDCDMDNSIMTIDKQVCRYYEV